ncbi:major facilitator superfamily MFS_1 [Ferroglobus placidus DSM 10642]|uniref:Major facilitator superfamily MFS_1 n=1 Tax=Ferroglobus placidus (strain DSM 10642 / AEDII12DO) TaxID=589924 RepID=D3RXI1_FERPA|nr:MFS transporter [Ferroglobus placidus]ADC65194.1 major facilitator superfamily MFS_1 [Ferroglobus placidus DSM 10642]
MKREEVYTLIVGLLGIFVGLGLARFAYTVILEPMKEGLNLSYTEMGAIASANFLGYVLFSPFVGYLASRLGSKIVVVSTLFLVTVTLFLTSFSTGFFDASIYRFLTGVGSAGVNVGLVGLAAKWFEIERRGFALGVINAGSSVGIIFAGITLPLVILSYDWRAGWVFLALISLFVTVLSLKLKETPAEFVPETKIEVGDVYRSRSLLTLGFSYVFFGLSYIVFVTFYTSHLIKIGVEYEIASGMWSLVGILSIISAILWGKISDAIGRKRALFSVYTIMGVAFILFGLSTNLPMAVLATILAGASMLAIPPLVQAYCGDLAGKSSASAAIGFVTLFFGVGQMIGPSVAGFLADVTGSFRIPLILAGTFALVGSVTVRKT